MIATSFSNAQGVTVAVLIGVILALASNRFRPDVVALAGAAILLMTGAVRPVQVQAAFASPAIIALASLFVMAHSMERSGLLDQAVRGATWLGRKAGAAGLWAVMLLCGGASAFLNNSPIVVLAAPVVRDVATSLDLPPKRFLMPLSYLTVLGGGCTLIGTSTNLLVNDMARAAGEPTFSIFEVTPVGVAIALAGLVYIAFASRRLGAGEVAPAAGSDRVVPAVGITTTVGDPQVFVEVRPFLPFRALASLIVFVGAITLAAMGVAPIAATAFAGAVLLILLRVITPEEAYGGLKPDILLLIAGMVVIGLAIEQTGLAAAATDGLLGVTEPLGPLLALAILYGVTLLLTELLSNATVAILVTPIAIALGESLGVDPRPFIVAVMMAGSAAFATPFGYQTNTIVYQYGKYSYMDFVRFGLPLNLITWAVGVAVIPIVFPF